MSPILPVPFLLISVALLIRAEFRGERRQICFFKPLSTLLVILIAALSWGRPGAEPGYTIGILAGLLLSLGGDVALIFSSRAFLAGLLLFLLAHVVYAVTFTLFSGFHPGDLISGAVLLALALALYRYLKPAEKKMRGPVVAYILIICFMVNRAVSVFGGAAFSSAQAWLVSAGAILFWISDLMLGINRFGRPFKYHRLSLAFYYGGQLLIALSPSYF